MAAKISSILDIIKTKIISKIGNKYNYNNYQSSNSLVLKLYYYFGTVLCFTITTCIFYNVFLTDTIICSDGMGNYDKKIKFLLVNYCHSYPELLTIKKKNFALFYKWVPWITGLLSILLYTVKIIINMSSCNYTAKYLLKIVRNNDYSNRYYHNEILDDQNNININKNDNIDQFNENDDDENELYKLINNKWNKCRNLYWGCLFSHIYALLLNIALFFLLDFLLQGRFLSYIPNTFPFNRDPKNFTDTMSQIFFPFAKCESSAGLLQLGRSEYLLCHLTLMEYYEKIFFILWIFLAITPILNTIYIIYLFFLSCNNYNTFLDYLLKRNLDSNVYCQAKKIIKKKKTNNSNNNTNTSVCPNIILNLINLIF